MSITIVLNCDAEGCEAREEIVLAGEALNDGVYVDMQSLCIDGYLVGPKGWGGSQGTIFDTDGEPPKALCPEHA